MPRAVSTEKKPHTLTPERLRPLSPAHVSLKRSPACGTDRNVHASLPVCMSQARTSPAGPRGGFSCVVPPVITRCLKTIGGEVRPLRPGRPRRISGVSRLTTPPSPKARLGVPVAASIE